jgi:hypothetical protein
MGNMDRKNGLAGIEVSLALQAQLQVIAVEDKQMHCLIPRPIIHNRFASASHFRSRHHMLTQPSSHQPQSAPHPSPHSSQHSLSARVQATKARAFCCKKAIEAP